MPAVSSRLASNITAMAGTGSSEGEDVEMQPVTVSPEGERNERQPEILHHQTSAIAPLELNRMIYLKIFSAALCFFVSSKDPRFPLI